MSLTLSSARPRSTSARSFAFIPQGGSTSRILNLNAEYLRRLGSQPRRKLIFDNPVLDRCIIIRHRPRVYERDDFPTPTLETLKLVRPFNPHDLRAGGQTIMMGQRGFESALRDLFGEDITPESDDRVTLSRLAELPSLDPYLVRLRMSACHPASRTWSLAPAEADADAMRLFATSAFAPVARTLFGATFWAPARLGRWIASPLGAAERSGEGGMTSGRLKENWAACAYFLWRADQVLSRIDDPIDDLLEIAGSPSPGKRGSDDFREFRAVVAQGMQQIRSHCAVLYAAMGDFARGRPGPFLSKLAPDAPFLVSFGGMVGAIDHVQSFGASYLEEFRAHRVSAPGKTEVIDELTEIVRAAMQE